MIRRSPSEYYIKFLVAHPDRYDNGRIKLICDHMGVDYLGDWYIDRLRSFMQVPKPFNPSDQFHLPSQRFIRKELIQRAFFPNEAMKQALKIVEASRPRELVEVMILSGAPHEAVVYGLKMRMDMIVEEDAIDYYRHYFWDVDLLDTTEMQAFLEMRLEKSVLHDDAKIRHQHSYMKKQRHNDPRSVAARLPVSPLAALMAQIRMGVMPRDINLTDVLHNVRMMSSLRALESTMVGGPVGAQMSSAYMMTADIANRLHETVIKPEDQLRKDLQNIGIRTIGAKTPMVAQLSGGMHTAQLQPEPKPEEEEEDDVKSAGQKG